MWKKSSGPVVNNSATVRRPTKTLSGEGIHAHSPHPPTGRTKSPNIASDVFGPIQYPEHKRYYYGEIGDGRATIPSSGPMSEPRLSYPQVNLPSGQAGTNEFLMSDDPFTGFGKGNSFLRRSKKSTVEDTPMPDYASSTTERTRVRSENSSMSYEPKEIKPTIDLTNDAVIVEMVKNMSPDRKDKLLVQALSPTKITGVHAPSNSPTSVTRLPTRPSPAARPRISSYEFADVAAEVADQAALIDAPSSLSENSLLEEEEIKPANIPIPPTPIGEQIASFIPAPSVGSQKQITPEAEDIENEPRSGSASVEVTRTSSTSYKYAISVDDRRILLPSNLDRPRSDSSGSKRKRSTPPSRCHVTDQDDSPSPHKRMSQEPQAP